MDRTSSEIYNYLCTYTGTTGSPGGPRSGGPRYSFSKNRVVIVNHLVPTSKSPNSRGYLNMKSFRVGDLSHEEIQHINKSQTMQIHSITFERFKELIHILVSR